MAFAPVRFPSTNVASRPCPTWQRSTLSHSRRVNSFSSRGKLALVPPCRSVPAWRPNLPYPLVRSRRCAPVFSPSPSTGQPVLGFSPRPRSRRRPSPSCLARPVAPIGGASVHPSLVFGIATHLRPRWCTSALSVAFLSSLAVMFGPLPEWFFVLGGAPRAHPRVCSPSSLPRPRCAPRPLPRPHTSFPTLTCSSFPFSVVFPVPFLGPRSSSPSSF